MGEHKDVETDKLRSMCVIGNGQIRKGGNTLTIEAVAPAPGFTECFFGLDRLVLHLQ